MENEQQKRPIDATSIATLHVTLRPVEPTDAAMVQRYASDERIAATSNVPHPYPSNGAAQYIASSIEASSKGTAQVFAILLDDDLVGLMTLNDVNHQTKTAALDYWVAVPFWGKGIATNAARLAIDFAFEKLCLLQLDSGCLARNPASARTLEKAGFDEIDGIIHDGAGTGRFDGEMIRLFCMSHQKWTSMRGEDAKHRA